MNLLIFATLLLSQLMFWQITECSTNIDVTSSWKKSDVNQLADMIVAYFRHQGVHSLMLVVCQQDIGSLKQNMQLLELLHILQMHNFFVHVNTEQQFTDLSRMPKMPSDLFAAPKTFQSDNQTRITLSFQLPLLAYKLGILLLSFNNTCALNLLRWSAASEHNYFTTNRFWLLYTQNIDDVALLEDVAIFLPPDSEVRILYHKPKPDNFYALVDVYKIAAFYPLKYRIVGRKLRNALQLTYALLRFGSAISYRKNLEGLQFNTGIVIAYPDFFTDIEDVSLRHIDTIPKINHRLMAELANFFNITYNSYQTHNYGWRQSNGSFDGLMGRFQRYEIDFALQAIFMRIDRLEVCTFIAETYRLRSGLMFRQPPLSAVANIFAMPFQIDIWISIIVMLIIIAVVLTFELFFSPHTHNMSYLDCWIFAWGAMCQQGFYVNVRNRSARIIVFTTFVAMFFLFTSFSANIVALLQSPSKAIQSLSDLGESPLEIGVQKTQYHKLYFIESSDPVTKNFYHKKISPKGDNIYIRQPQGMEKVRTGLFAYLVELQAGYQIVSDTFSEPEKCGLMELEPFQLPMMSIPTRKNFQYKELFRRQLRWQREVGLVNREAGKWLPQKPKCEGGVSGFVSIGITECRYALGIFGCGILLSLIVFLLEILTKRSIAYSQNKLHNLTVGFRK